MAKDYMMVRLSVQTWHQLKVMQAAMQQSNIDMKSELPENEIYGVTLDTVVRELIEREWRHRLASGKKKRPESVQEALGGMIPPADQ